MGGSVYPSKDKWLTHSGGDMGYAGKSDAEIRAASKKKSTLSSATKSRPQQGQLLDSTGKMTKARALATGNDRSTRGSR